MAFNQAHIKPLGFLKGDYPPRWAVRNLSDDQQAMAEAVRERRSAFPCFSGMNNSIRKAAGRSMADGINILSSDAMIKIIETRLPGGRALTLLLSVTAALAGIGFCGGIAMHDLVIPLIVWVHDLVIEIPSGWPTLHFPEIPQLVAWSFASGVVAVALLYATYYVFGMIDLLRRNMLHNWDHHIHTWDTFELLTDQTSKSIGELTDMVRILSERIERLEASDPSTSQ